MGKYRFNLEYSGDFYKLIFLCGSKYVGSNKSDKRNVLRKHLLEKNPLYRPIILEDNFIFSKKTTFLAYGDIYMRNLYDVEFLVSLLSDAILIFHESISTGAEAGLFLGEHSNKNKTCLIVPNKEAVEEDKLGAFLRLSFFKGYKPVKQITYYPSVQNNITSVNLRNLHTSFVNNSVGEALSKKILDFIGNKKKSLSGQGFSLNYKKATRRLTARIISEKILLCVAAMMSKDFLAAKLFNKKLTMQEAIKIIKVEMEKLIIWTYEERYYYKFATVPEVHFENKFGTIEKVIGMSLYLFSAAEFIEIKKDEEYEENSEVVIKRKKDNGKYYFTTYSELVTQIEEDKNWNE